MKCLSINQPMAELIVSGRKTIELRSWNTKFRGNFLIHASLRVDRAACIEFGMQPEELVTGAVIGRARLLSVKRYTNIAGWVNDKNRHLAGFTHMNPRFGFVIGNPVRLRKPVAMKGRLGFFNVDWK
jgi:hypothetical protein